VVHAASATGPCAAACGRPPDTLPPCLS
jgi:hypothetical protein